MRGLLILCGCMSVIYGAVGIWAASIGELEPLAITFAVANIIAGFCAIEKGAEA